MLGAEEPTTQPIGVQLSQILPDIIMMKNILALFRVSFYFYRLCNWFELISLLTQEFPVHQALPLPPNTDLSYLTSVQGWLLALAHLLSPTFCKVIKFNPYGLVKLYDIFLRWSYTINNMKLGSNLLGFRVNYNYNLSATVVYNTVSSITYFSTSQ